MGIFSWIFLGLIAGAIAKFVMPGKDPGGIIVTILIGIAGAIVGGFLGSFVGLGKVESFDPRWNFHRHHRRHHPLDHLSIAEEKIVATIDRLIICTFSGLVVSGRVDTGSSDKILAILNTKFQGLKAS